MRNPFARCVFLAVALVLFVALTWRTDVSGEVRDQFTKAAGSVSNHASSGQPNSAGDVASTKPKPGAPLATTRHVMDCDIDLSHMQALRDKYSLAGEFEYARRYIKIDRQPIERESLTKIAGRLLAKPFTKVNLDSGESIIKETCAEPLRAPVSQSMSPATGDLSDFLFGVSTTFKRFNDTNLAPAVDWSFWLTNGRGKSNGGKLLLLLLDANDEELTYARGVLSGLGIDADVYHSDSKMEMAVRYLALTPTLYNHPERANRKWMVLCDDDTFFPSVHQLKATFEKYNNTKPLYIGTLSEDIGAVQRHGSQAFGGAGVFISRPLAKIVSDKFQSCSSDQKIKESNSGWGPQGDILLRKCIYENTDVRLTIQNDLWQLDLLGDPSGFYESGGKPLSLHHFNGGGWHHAVPYHYGKISHICGEDCMLQRFQTEDNFIISTGYSIANYPKGVDFSTDMLERTFVPPPDDYMWNFDYMFGPQRPALHKTGRKIAWDGQEARINPDNTVVQTYVRHFNDWRWVNPSGEPISNADGIIELVWLP